MNFFTSIDEVSRGHIGKLVLLMVIIRETMKFLKSFFWSPAERNCGGSGRVDTLKNTFFKVSFLSLKCKTIAIISCFVQF